MLSIALFVRFWGIDWQLPAALYFDEMKYVAWAGDAKDDASTAVTDLRNPTLFHHLLQAEYAVASLVRRDTTSQETAVFELRLARLTSAVLGSLACLLTALAASTLVCAVGGLRAVVPTQAPTVGRDAAWAGFAAGLILAFAPLHVHLSHYAVNDATASLFLAATLLFGVRALAGGHWRDLLLAGVMAGLAFSTKYSFAVGLVMPLMAAVVIARAPPPTARGANIGSTKLAFPLRGIPGRRHHPPCVGEEEMDLVPPLPRMGEGAGGGGSFLGSSLAAGPRRSCSGLCLARRRSSSARRRCWPA